MVLAPSIRATCLALSLLLCIAPANADLSLDALGDPELGGSWFQAFRLAGATEYRNLGIILTDAEMPVGANPRNYLFAGFEASAMDFSIPGGTANWGETDFEPGPDVGYMTESAGPSTHELVWRSHFIDEPETHAFTLTLFTYNSITSSTAIGEASATWNGSEWHFDVPRGVTWEEFQDITHAPAPAAAMLAMIGFSVLGVRNRFSR